MKVEMYRQIFVTFSTGEFHKKDVYLFSSSVTRKDRLMQRVERAMCTVSKASRYEVISDKACCVCPSNCDGCEWKLCVRMSGFRLSQR